MVRHPVEDLDVDVAHRGADHPEDGIGQEFHGGKIHRAGEEDGRPAKKLVEDGVGHDGGDDAGQDGLEFEFRFPVKHLRGEQGRPQGRMEDGSDAPGGAGQHQDAPLPGREF